MLREAQGGTVLTTRIVAWKADRLSRGMYPAVALMEAIEGTGIKLEAVMDTFDENTFALLAVLGKIELDNMKHRMRMGKKARAAKGKAPAITKFGYTRDVDGYPVHDPTEAPVVIRIFELYCAGTHPSEIAKILNVEGHVTRKGLQWAKSHIHYIVDDPLYIGKGYYGRRRRHVVDLPEEDREVVRYQRRPEEEWIDVPHPPIVSDAVWEAAQVMRKKYHHIYQHKGLDLTFPLRGLAWCGFCGSRLYHLSGAAWEYKGKGGAGKKIRMDHRPRSRRYRCAGSINKRHDCPQKSYGAKKLEARVWKLVRQFIEDPDSIEAMIREREEAFTDGESLPRMRRYEAELESLEHQQQRAVTAFVKAYIDENGLAAQLKIINERQAYYKAEAEQLRNEIGSIEYQLVHLRSLHQATSHVSERLDLLTEEEKVEIVNLICEKVVVSGDEVIVHLAVNRGIKFTASSR